MRRGRALVIAVHEPAAPVVPPSAEVVIAVDGGLEAARSAGWPVHAVVGDLDSASAESLDWARGIGARIEAHPARKDETDLELAIEFARGQAAEVHVLASAGGRLDHAAANLLVLASPRWADTAVSATVDGAHVDVVRGRRPLGGEVGDTVSLLAVGGPALVASTWGLEYPLSGEWLSPTGARGVSNVIVGVPPVVDVAEGVLLAIRPGAGRDLEAERMGRSPRTKSAGR